MSNDRVHPIFQPILAAIAPEQLTMSDPIWNKTAELTQGYPAEFNAMAVYNLVRDAWRMGFNVVRDPAAPALYLEFIRAQNEALRNCPANGIAGLQNAHQPGPES